MIGEIPVTSGQVIVLDPCHAQKFTRDDYDNASIITAKKGIAAGETFNKGLGRTPLAVACATPSDGKFKIYLFTDDEDNPISLAIDLARTEG